MTKEEFIDKAKKVHGDKYDYEKVIYSNNKTKVIIICREHGEFTQTPNKHLLGRGCPKCAVDYRANLKRWTTEDFIREAIKIHGDRYDYSLVDYKLSKEKVKIICKKHGLFEQIAVNHIGGQNCPLCVREKQALDQKYNTEIFIEKAHTVHRGFYLYNSVDYIDSVTKIIITCPIHGEFSQLPSNHLQGQGCPKCVLKSQSKIYEGLIADLSNVSIVWEATPEWLEPQRFDIYLPDHNIAVEYNGIQHYKPIEAFRGKSGFDVTQQRDSIKRQKCKENNCTLFEVRYDYSEDDYKRLVDDIKSIINKNN